MFSDSYKGYDYGLVRMKMATIVSPSSPSMNHYENSDNRTALLSLVALFYAKGDVSTAIHLMESLQK